MTRIPELYRNWFGAETASIGMVQRFHLRVRDIQRMGIALTIGSARMEKKRRILARNSMKKYKVTIIYAGNCSETITFNTKEEANNYINCVGSPHSNIKIYIEEVEK